MYKKMRVLVTIFVLIILVTSISSCGVGGGGVGDGGGEGDFQPHTGTQSLEMLFSPGSPPSVIYSNQNNIPMLLEIRNKGAHPLSGQIFLSGFDSNIITITPNRFSISNLDPVTTINREGGLMIENLKITSIRMPPGLDRYNPTLQITACYDYETKASPMICVDPQPYKGIASDKTCVPGVISVGAGQGAPVSVGSIEQEIIPGKEMLFRVRLVNNGGGDIVTTTACDKPLEYNQVNLMSIQDSQITISGASIEVQPKDLKFNNNAATIFVKSSMPTGGGGTEYLTAMTINLKYKYRKTYSRRLEIRNTQSYSGTP